MNLMTFAIVMTYVHFKTFVDVMILGNIIAFMKINIFWTKEKKKERKNSVS